MPSRPFRRCALLQVLHAEQHINQDYLRTLRDCFDLLDEDGAFVRVRGVWTGCKGSPLPPAASS